MVKYLKDDIQKLCPNCGSTMTPGFNSWDYYCDAECDLKKDTLIEDDSPQNSGLNAWDAWLSQSDEWIRPSAAGGLVGYYVQCIKSCNCFYEGEVVTISRTSEYDIFLSNSLTKEIPCSLVILKKYFKLLPRDYKPEKFRHFQGREHDLIGRKVICGRRRNGDILDPVINLRIKDIQNIAGEIQLDFEDGTHCPHENLSEKDNWYTILPQENKNRIKRKVFGIIGII